MGRRVGLGTPWRDVLLVPKGCAGKRLLPMHFPAPAQLSPSPVQKQAEGAVSLWEPGKHVLFYISGEK